VVFFPNLLIVFLVVKIEDVGLTANDREREILYSRRLNDDPTTLEDLSKKYKISRERVRQIENKAFEKLQKQMLLLAKSKNLLPAN
jgi:RNA polymerase sigma-32 factor